MRPGILISCALASLLLSAASTARAQGGEWVYRARVGGEGSASSRGTSGLLLMTADSTWDDGRRIRVGGGLIFTGEDGGRVDVRAREAFARVSATPWMDIEAGKRLLRWGVGYGFAPSGVLDPPRASTDPTDRLGRNEGLLLARADLFRGDSSLSVAAAEDRVLAARARTVVAGVEVALVARADRGGHPAWGGNITHVVGQRLEWHAEVLSQERFSAVAGVQYTFAGGPNVVLEYHRNGDGPGGHRQSLFMRLARAGGEAAFAPEVIVVAGLEDGGWTMVPGITWTPRGRLQVYARGIRVAGSTAFTVGTAVRF